MSTYHKIIQPLVDFLDEVAYRVKRNPALVGSAAVAAYSSLTAGHLTASAVVAVVVGFLVRSQVVPAAEVEAFVEHATGVVADLHAAVHASANAALTAAAANATPEGAKLPDAILARQAVVPAAPVAAPEVAVPATPAAPDAAPALPADAVQVTADPATADPTASA